MPAEHDLVDGPRADGGSTTGRPAGREPAWLDPDDDASGSAWEDLSGAGSGAWDDDRAGAAGPAWADDAAGPGGAWKSPASAGSGVWDDDAPAPASAWLEDAGDEPTDSARAGRSSVRAGRAARSPSRTRGRGAARPETPDDAANGEPGRAPRGRAGAGGATGTTGFETDGSGTGGSGTGGSGTGGSETLGSGVAGPGVTGSGTSRPEVAASGEVAAVAARLAEIVARRGSGAGGPVPDALTGAAGGGLVPADNLAPDDDLEPTARRRSVGRSGAGRGSRARGGRRAPAAEPPRSGAAASDAEPDPESVARAIALRQLTAAPRSRAQLAEAMARRDVPEDVAERVLDRFTEVGLVDDAAYAEILVRSRHAERKLSRRALAQELRRKGVDDEIAREALEQVDDEEEELAARALARKKLAATRGLDREVRLRRAYGALGRKGYGGSLVSRVVREELAAEGAAEDGD